MLSILTGTLLFCAAAAMAEPMLVHGAGATFPQPLYAQWADEYKRETGVEVRYTAVGSGAGVARLLAREVDFGATDVPLSAEALQSGGLLQFPAAIGGVVPVFNVTGIGAGALRLTGEVLGDIYLGRIRKWDDPALTALNPGLKLPSAYITVVHRAESSGTSFLWSAFLAASNAPWKAAVGTGSELAWPVGVAGIGNEGVASYVQRTRMSIGYVEFAYARRNHLTTAALRNRDGVFVTPSREAFAAAATAAHWDERSGFTLAPAGLGASAGGAAGWPITGATFIVAHAQPADLARSLDVIRFFDWALMRGQRSATALDYVALPERITRQIESSWQARLRDASGAAVWSGPRWPR